MARPYSSPVAAGSDGSDDHSLHDPAIERPAEAGQVQRQEVVAGVDARAAVDDRLFARGAERLVAPPQVRPRP